MRTLEECRAEVFLRSEKRIKEIKTRRRRTLTLGIVTALTVTALLSSLLPMAMNKPSAQPSKETSTTRPIVEGDGLTGNEQDNDTRPHPEGPDSEGMDIEIVYDIEADYCIVSDGESYYLIIDNEEYYNSDSNANVEEPLLTFTSVEEMKDKVLGGKLTEKEKQTMSQFSKDENGNIKVLDFSKLCTPSLPEGASVEFVHWNGQSYSLSINTPSAGYCNFFVMDSEQYNVSFKRDYEDKLLNNPLVHIFKTEQIEERNATVYHHTTSAGEFRDIRYTIEVEAGTLTVSERYCVRRNHDLISVSETIPQRIEIFGEVDGKYFRCLLIDLTERPSVEWLSSFGLVELE